MDYTRRGCSLHARARGGRLVRGRPKLRHFPLGAGGRPARPRKVFMPRHSAVAECVAVVFLAAVLLVACDKGYSRFMKLPADPAVSSGIGWGMVNMAYATMRSEPTQNSEAVTVIRGGTVFRCLERKIDAAGEDLGGLWYRYNDGSSRGWLHDADIKLFSSEEQARKAAQTQMKSGVKR